MSLLCEPQAVSCVILSLLAHQYVVIGLNESDSTETDHHHQSSAFTYKVHFFFLKGGFMYLAYSPSGCQHNHMIIIFPKVIMLISCQY